MLAYTCKPCEWCVSSRSGKVKEMSNCDWRKPRKKLSTLEQPMIFPWTNKLHVLTLDTLTVNVVDAKCLLKNKRKSDISSSGKSYLTFKIKHWLCFQTSLLFVHKRWHTESCKVYFRLRFHKYHIFLHFSRWMLSAIFL